MFLILALDGGGLRSIFTARIIARICKEYPAFLKNVDMFAGNSGGAIVAAALATGYTPDQVVNLFYEEGPYIFKDSLGDDIRDLGNLIGAKYSTAPRRKVFEKYFQDKTLADVRKRLLFPSFDLQHPKGWQPVSFHNFDKSPNKNTKISDAVLASSAAPTYFPVVKVGNSRFSDGGTWANNPALAALSESIKISHGGKKLRDIVIFNIGTIESEITLKANKLDLGIADWFRNDFLDLLLDTAIYSNTYHVKNLLGEQYHRLNLRTKNLIPMDDPDQLGKLVELADSVDLSEALAWLQGFWYKRKAASYIASNAYSQET